MSSAPSYNSYETALYGVDQIAMTNAYGPHKIIYVRFFYFGLSELVLLEGIWELVHYILESCQIVAAEGNCFNMHLFTQRLFLLTLVVLFIWFQIYLNFVVRRRELCCR